MTDEAAQTQEEPEEVVDGVPVSAEVEAAHTEQEIAGAVEEALQSADLTVTEPGDLHEGLIAMDANDAARLLDRLTTQAQERHLGKRWVYELPGGKGRGLTIDAVQDIVQQMNWTGKCAIGVLPETLQVERIEADEGDGPEQFWVATIAAVDERTGSRQIGTSMEPQNMHKKDGTRPFDRFSRTKAIGKAQRNAMEAFIPEIVKLTLIAMAAKDPQMIEHVQTDAEAKVSELPAPLDTPEAKALIEELGTMYDEIRGLGGGRGRVLLPPGQYNAYLVQSQHSMELLARMKDWLVERRQQIKKEVESE